MIFSIIYRETENGPLLPWTTTDTVAEAEAVEEVEWLNEEAHFATFVEGSANALLAADKHDRKIREINACRLQRLEEDLGW
mgnify:CR=1 FL=1